MAFILQSLVANTKHDQNSFDFAKKIKGITLKPEETTISNDVVGLFSSLIPVKLMLFTKRYLEILQCNQTNLSCSQICDLLHLYLDNTYLSYNGHLYQQCHGCPMGSQVSPIV